MKITPKTIGPRFGALIAYAVALGGLALAPSAHAGGGVHWSIGVSSPGVAVGVSSGWPGYVTPAPVYVQPQPVYVQPQPVYVHPRPVYVHPRPVFAPPPVYYAPLVVRPPIVVQPVPIYSPGWRGHHRHHRHHHHHRRGHGSRH